jgi:small subunit ribosomal protein S17
MARKQRTGVVQSDKMEKTVVVMVERTVTHPLYKKVLRRRKQYQAHDETNTCALGDKVLIEECRPISKNKHWRVVEILERHEVADIQPSDIRAPVLDGPTPPASAPDAPNTPTDSSATDSSATDDSGNDSATDESGNDDSGNDSATDTSGASA